MINSVGALLRERENNLFREKLKNGAATLIQVQERKKTSSRSSSDLQKNKSSPRRKVKDREREISALSDPEGLSFQLELWDRKFSVPYNKNLDFLKYQDPLLRNYLKLGQAMYVLAYSSYFSNFMIFCIITAGLLVGAETYPSLQNNHSITVVDWFITIAFAAEVVLKVVAEGLAPWLYFCGSSWGWNNFDFAIVVICFVPSAAFNPKDVRLVRLFRLLRVAKIVRKIPQMQIIVMGLVGGLRSITYIFLLLCLVYYLYAIIGIMLFASNDPLFMGELHRTMLALFKTSTIEDWMDVMYINMWGCDKWPHGYYVAPGDEARQEVFWCSHPKEQKLIGVIYFVSFIVLASLVMMSLFIGAVTMAMAESMEAMTLEREEAERERKAEKGRQKAAQLQAAADSHLQIMNSFHKDLEGSHMSEAEIEKEISKHAQLLSKKEREFQRLQHLMVKAWNGLEMVDEDVVLSSGNRFYRNYSRFSNVCFRIVESKQFGDFVTVMIIVAGIEIGIQTFDNLTALQISLLKGLDSFIVAVFTLEMVLRIVGEEFEPWRYFYSSWNVFDAVVVIGSLCQTGGAGSGGGNTFMLLRLLRLLRVLKLVTRLPHLQVIVQAMIYSLNSIGIIGFIILLFDYIYANIGMIFFARNDPRHYGTLHETMIQLFKVQTREDWSEPVYINAYGCDQVPYYEEWPWLCTHPESMYALSVIYHCLFVLVAALILLTLFIGVVTTSMETCVKEMETNMEVNKRVCKIQDKYEVSDEVLVLYREVFRLFDLDGGGSVEKDELAAGLNVVGLHPHPEELNEIFGQVDLDGSGQIDFSEFFELLMLTKAKKDGKVVQKQPTVTVNMLASIQPFQTLRKLSIMSGGAPSPTVGSVAKKKSQHKIVSRNSSKVSPGDIEVMSTSEDRFSRENSEDCLFKRNSRTPSRHSHQERCYDRHSSSQMAGQSSIELLDCDGTC